MNTTLQPTLGYILKGYPRISETFISNEILLLEQFGFKVRLFSMRHPREKFSHQSVKKIQARVDYLPTDLAQDFNKLMLPAFFAAARNPATFKSALLTAGKKFKKNRKVATLKHLLQACYLTNLLDGDSVKHLHGHFAHSPTSVTMFASILSGIPFSFTAHAKDIYTSKPAHLKEKIENAKFVVTCTKYNGKYLEEVAQGAQTPIHAIYHGIDTTLFDSVGAKHNPKPPYSLFTVARMTEKKGLPTIYRALAHLRDRGIEFKHSLIGDGPDKEDLKKLITELQLEGHCSLMGTQNHETVLATFRASDLFVLGCEIAKDGDRDGLPNVLVESLAMGVPAISTHVSAIPEMLINYKTGITVPPSDPVALAEGIEQLLKDESLRKRCITEGQALVKNNFSNRHWVKELGDLFHRESPELIQP